MPICRLCTSPDAKALARDIRRGLSIRTLASRYTVPKSTMHKHTRHVAPRVHGQPRGHPRGQTTGDLSALQATLAAAQGLLDAHNTAGTLQLVLQSIEQLVTTLLAPATSKPSPPAGK